MTLVKDSLGKKSQIRASPNQRFIGYKLKNRFHTYEFAQLPALMNYKYYLNIEVGTELLCDVGTDFFELMNKNPNLQFGFANAPADSRTSTKTLFKNYMQFFKTDVSKRRPVGNNLMDFSVKKLRKTGQLKYSTCNFDSNFEIAELSLFRTDSYREFFEHFDNAYGQFYERWTDYNIKSLYISTFVPSDHIFWVDNLGFFDSQDRTVCPANMQSRLDNTCVCDPDVVKESKLLQRVQKKKLMI
ncbi:unnamed protein product [Ambrosiozyma monospora]|uniref:Unnamed protein product n=1 Tax=Ambrosiozyma monospora TaxID=43982 RepID=A0A9W6SUR4_AMBMO|nr:unnamed protein product [Ambrosiozyma monospora]